MCVEPGDLQDAARFTCSSILGAAWDGVRGSQLGMDLYKWAWLSRDTITRLMAATAQQSRGAIGADTVITIHLVCPRSPHDAARAEPEVLVN